MPSRFKPVLAAAVAAGAIPLLDNPATVSAAQITAAGWAVEATTITGSTAGSVTLLADVFSPGYGGTMTGTLINSTGAGWSLFTGNGSSRAMGANSWASGGSYTFGFSIDQVDTLLVRFDMRSSATGPGQFIVQYSNDNSVFSNAGTALITTALTWSTGATNSQTAASYSFAFPTGFGDPFPGIAGDKGYVRFLQAGNAVNGGAVSNAGTNAVDNVFIIGQSIPEPTSMVMTLAAAAGLVSRPKRRD